MPRGGGDGRAVEGLAIRELPSTSQREYEAVRRAVETTEHYRNGQERLKVIELVLWKKTHNLQGAASRSPAMWTPPRSGMGILSAWWPAITA